MKDWYFQEDNSPVHKSIKVKEYMKRTGIRVIEWSPKSPDLNVVEDFWKRLSDLVYDGK